MSDEKDFIIENDARIYTTQTPFTMVNTMFLQTKGEFTAHEKLMYVLIKSHVNEQSTQNEPSAFPSYERLIELSGLSKNTVIKAVSGLVDKKMITKLKTFKKSQMKWKNSYIVHTYEEAYGIPGAHEMAEPKEEIPFAEIIDYLNKKTGREGVNLFKPGSKSTQRNIRARWNNGYRLKDFIHVIDVKVEEWLGNEAMETYLNPETLFGTKFETRYIGQKLKGQSGKKPIFAEPKKKSEVSSIAEINGKFYDLKIPEEKAMYMELLAMQMGLKNTKPQQPTQ